ncbi:hypothetical protein Csa_012629 [Cucumis sativus]|uniref:Uncharacterized protein n=1 Tax=Cucumis sativus TaxID=3659 RepID=A0A0A0L432_CUCSA|nr:hypothetical protein Csa_012629 [Cucumis sativus]
MFPPSLFFLLPFSESPFLPPPDSLDIATEFRCSTPPAAASHSVFVLDTECGIPSIVALAATVSDFEILMDLVHYDERLLIY